MKKTFVLLTLITASSMSAMESDPQASAPADPKNGMVTELYYKINVEQENALENYIPVALGTQILRDKVKATQDLHQYARSLAKERNKTLSFKWLHFYKIDIGENPVLVEEKYKWVRYWLTLEYHSSFDSCPYRRIQPFAFNTVKKALLKIPYVEEVITRADFKKIKKEWRHNKKQELFSYFPQYSSTES